VTLFFLCLFGDHFAASGGCGRFRSWFTVLVQVPFVYQGINKKLSAFVMKKDPINEER